jgi:hypothetical protein
VYTQEVVFPVGTWLSLVEHSLGVRGVGSSNLPVPTIKIIRIVSPLQEGRWIPRHACFLAGASRGQLVARTIIDQPARSLLRVRLAKRQGSPLHPYIVVALGRARES